MMQFRNEYPVFDGEMTVHDAPDEYLWISWKEGQYRADLKANLKDHSFVITYLDHRGVEKILDLNVC